MNARDRKELKRLAEKLKTQADDLNETAESIEVYVMKQTTQRSNEFRGGANC